MADIFQIVMHFAKYGLFALVWWTVAVIIFESLGGVIAPIGDAKPGDPFNAASVLDTLHILGVQIMPLVILGKGVFGSIYLVMKPDSQVAYTSRGRRR